MGNFLRIPLGKTVKQWFGLDSFYLPLPSNLKFEDIKELRISPRNQCFYAEFVYLTEAQIVELNPENVLGLDPGLNNWLTGVSSVGTSFIIDGKHLKSVNRWYNKKVSTLKEGKPQETEESYTSKASFLDRDLLPTFGAKPDGWQPSGKRIQRGLYQTAQSQSINADANGAANIIRKVITTLNLDLSRVHRGVLTRPQKLKFWSAKKTLRNEVLTRCVASF